MAGQFDVGQVVTNVLVDGQLHPVKFRGEHDDGGTVFSVLSSFHGSLEFWSAAGDNLSAVHDRAVSALESHIRLPASNIGANWFWLLPVTAVFVYLADLLLIALAGSARHLW